MPSPPCERLEALARPGRTCRRPSAASPGRCRCPCPAPGRRPRRPPGAAASRIRPPGSVYLAALFSRLPEDLLQPGRVGLQPHRPRRAARRSARGPARRSGAGPSRPPAARPVARSTTSLRSSILPLADAGTRPAGRRPAGPGARPAARSSPARPRSAPPSPVGLLHQDLQARCGSGPAGCAARGPASPGTRPCGGRPPASASSPAAAVTSPGDVAEVADDAVPPAGECPDAMDLPVVVFEHPAVEPSLDALGDDARLAGCEGMPEPPHDLGGIRRRPEQVDDLHEVAADQPVDVAEDRAGLRVHLPDAQVGIHHVTPMGAASRTASNRAWLRRASSSALFMSSMSVHVPNHLTIRPASSRTGNARPRNQRYSPSFDRKRYSIS